MSRHVLVHKRASLSEDHKCYISYIQVLKAYWYDDNTSQFYLETDTFEELFPVMGTNLLTGAKCVMPPEVLEDSFHKRAYAKYFENGEGKSYYWQTIGYRPVTEEQQYTNWQPEAEENVYWVGNNKGEIFKPVRSEIGMPQDFNIEKEYLAKHASKLVPICFVGSNPIAIPVFPEQTLVRASDGVRYARIGYDNDLWFSGCSRPKKTGIPFINRKFVLPTVGGGHMTL